jgi:hypothetical protein
MHSLSFVFLTAIHFAVIFQVSDYFPTCVLKVKRLTKVFLSTDFLLIPPLVPVFCHAPDERGRS